MGNNESGHGVREAVKGTANYLTSPEFWLVATLTVFVSTLYLIGSWATRLSLFVTDKALGTVIGLATALFVKGKAAHVKEWMKDGPLNKAMRFVGNLPFINQKFSRYSKEKKHKPVRGTLSKGMGVITFILGYVLPQSGVLYDGSIKHDAKRGKTEIIGKVGIENGGKLDIGSRLSLGGSLKFGLAEGKATIDHNNPLNSDIDGKFDWWLWNRIVAKFERDLDSLNQSRLQIQETLESIFEEPENKKTSLDSAGDSINPAVKWHYLANQRRRA